MEPQREERGKGALWSWAMLIACCALIVAWGLFNYFMIQDVPRQWRFGALPATPSQSIYSTSPALQSAATPWQIAPLPEAQAATSQSATAPGAAP